MKLIIEVPDEIYNRVVVSPRCVTDLEAFRDRDIFVKALQKGIPLPKDATNGDVIKAMFSVKTVDDFCRSFGVRLNNSNYIQFNKDWWNAPYKGGQEDADSD